MKSQKIRAILSDYNVLAWCFAALFLLLAVVPAKGAFGRMKNFDKFSHFISFYLFVLFINAAHNWNYRLKYLFYGLAFGFLIELIQSFLPWRDANLKDFIFDALGAFLAVLTPRSSFPLIMTLIATSGGIGFSPIMPGTIASFVALLVYYFLPVNARFLVFSIPALLLLGLWASEYRSNYLEDDDPSSVVIDEAVGVLLAVMFFPKKFIFLVLGFILFRIFDIWKPWFVNHFQRLPGGLGIMADDIAAGVLANLTLRLLRFILKI